ncbi:MAG: hypothetical protein DWQ36_06285 [Acidobacteria bacterium]|nr:MAG: hypothetical protein DWQ30_19290 [Acidobacteriota bacterium]REK09653.1 MAG: hypothetical protein DWQ36_06285 [Acidobacteriota bacterium]
MSDLQLFVSLATSALVYCISSATFLWVLRVNHPRSWSTLGCPGVFRGGSPQVRRWLFGWSFLSSGDPLLTALGVVANLSIVSFMLLAIYAAIRALSVG